MKNSRYDEWIGTLAAFLTTPAMIPQAIKIWQNMPHPVESISTPTFVILSTGMAMWFLYGLRIRKPVIVVANGISLAINLSILIYKGIYG